MWTTKKLSPPKIQTETGKQAVARSIERPSLIGKNGLESHLFPQGLQKDTVELIGAPASGKTIMLTHLISRCLLPTKWHEQPLGGCGASAVLLNTDHHFSVLQLAELMEAEARKVVPHEHVEEIVKTSLQNLSVFNCYNSDCLTATIVSLDYMLMENPKVALVAIDSLLAFYWADRLAKGAQRWDSYKKSWLNIFQKAFESHSVAFVYTQQLGIKEESGNEEDIHIGPSTLRIHLKRNMSSQYQADVISNTAKITSQFVISSRGIKWMS